MYVDPCLHNRQQGEPAASPARPRASPKILLSCRIHRERSPKTVAFKTLLRQQEAIQQATNDGIKRLFYSLVESQQQQQQTDRAASLGR